MRRRWNEVNTRTCRAWSVSIFALAMLPIVMMSSCGAGDRRAERLWRQAIERVESGDTQGAVDRLQRIIDEFPDSSVAERARDQIVVYRGLATAVQRYPSRRARASMVQIARAIEGFRRDRGRYPATLDELIPVALPSVPPDPWNRPFLYEATARGYRLTCLGADGEAGGDAESEDVAVIDGAFSPVQP